jgi:hypothetical protein
MSLNRQDPYHTPIEDVMGLIDESIDHQTIERGRQRQEAVWLGRSPDYLPLLLGHTPVNAGGLHHNRRYKLSEHELVGGVVVEELERYPHYDLIDQLEDPEKMLYEALWEIVSWSRSRSDAQLAVRVNMLQWAIASAFGMNPKFDRVETPWATDHLAKEDLDRLEVDGLETRGYMPRVLEFLDYFRSHLPPGVHQYAPAAPGPLCFANYLFGDDWYWTDFYDDPAFIQRALSFCAKVHCYVCRLYRRRIGQSDDFTYDGSLYMTGAAIKVPDDSNVLISADMWRQFDRPHVASCFAAFDGGWYHSCGRYREKLDALLEVPEITAINFGDPGMWNQDEVVPRIIEAGKIYYGGWARKPSEPLEDYLRRAVLAAGPERKGLIIMLMEQEGTVLPHPEETMVLWHRLQDQGAF